MTLETRFCPHCGVELSPWVGPPESGWGLILVCNNNECSFFSGSGESIRHKEPDSPLGCRYAEDPDNGYTPFNLLSWMGPSK